MFVPYVFFVVVLNAFSSLLCHLVKSLEISSFCDLAIKVLSCKHFEVEKKDGETKDRKFEECVSIDNTRTSVELAKPDGQ